MTTVLPPLIPAPASIEALPGTPLDPSRPGSYRVADDMAPTRRIAAALTDLGWRAAPVDGAVTIASRTDLAGAGPEAFEAVIGGDAIELIGASQAGCHAAAGLVTQLLRLATGPIRSVRIADAPRYAWRGLSVDIARSFFGPETLRRVADLAALYRFNRLHLHLTDDQGWRLELTCRPALTERSGRTASDGGEAGFLTAAQYREFDRHCADRGLVLVPEIDVPGHTNAALHACPELTPDGVAPEPYGGDDVGFSRLHLGVPATEPFLRDVFAEVASLTSGRWLHVGGDEALSLGDEEYRGLVTIALDAVRAAGKNPVGWQEISPAVDRAGVLVEYWTPDRAEALIDAARRGARVLIAPGHRTYLDMVYRAGDPGQDWACPISLTHAIDWRPDQLLAPLGLPPEAIEGVEAAIWTEFIHTEERLFGMLLPRLAGIAEIAWAGGAIGGAADLRSRVLAHRSAWGALGIRADWPATAFTG